MKQRITAGRIEDLGIDNQDLERIGFVTLRDLTTSKTSLLINTVDKEETVRRLPNCGADELMKTVQAYLEKIDGYLTHTQYSGPRGGLLVGLQRMSGDLYKSKKKSP